MQQTLRLRGNVCLDLHTLFENECSKYKKGEIILMGMYFKNLL